MIASLLLSCCSFSFVFGCGLFFGGFKGLPVNGCSIVVILVLSHLPSGPILNLQNPLVYLGSFICGEMYSDSSNMHIGCPIIICVKDRLKLKKAILVCTMLPEWSQCCSVMSDSLWPHCSLLGLSVYGILQASILEWVAVPFSRVSSKPRDQTQVFHIAGGFFTIWATREATRTLEWVVYTFSRGFSWLRNQTRVSWIAGRFFISWATRGALQCWLHWDCSSRVTFKIIKKLI